MYKVALLNMPFAQIKLPSIALTQLSSVLRSQLGGKVDVKIFYLHLDFARYLGVENYLLIGNQVEAVTAGLGDWFFRHVAFPEAADNSDLYFNRHFSERRQEVEILRRRIEERRLKTSSFLDELIDRHDLESYDLVGLTSMFSQSVACISMARLLKQRKTKLVTVMGGANCESPMGQVLVRQAGPIDFVASGPSLVSFPQLVGYLVDGEEEKCHRIPGILSKQKLDQGRSSPHEQGRELDIDVDVPLDYEDFLTAFDDFRGALGKASDDHFELGIPFETSRGCWWGELSHCTFCGLNGATMKYRSMQPPKALELLRSLFERYAERATFFQSVDNIMPREYLKEVFPHLETPEHVRIFFEVKADLKDREMEILARARVQEIQPGIEALATSTLKLMRKGTTAFQNLRFLKSCRVHGIDPQWNLLIGFPGEEEEVYEKYYDDLPLLIHLPPPSGVFPVRFDRYSPYHREAQAYDLELKPCDFYEMIYPFDKDCFEELAYFFVDRNYDARYIKVTAKWLAKLRSRIDYWHTRWSQKDHGLAPRLTLKTLGDGKIVHDTRSGTVVEHRLSPAGLRILELVNNHPSKLPRLVARFEGDLLEGQIEREITVLKDRGLLFQEQDLYMSLVSEEDVRSQPVLLPTSDAAEEFNFA